MAFHAEHFFDRLSFHKSQSILLFAAVWSHKQYTSLLEQYSYFCSSSTDVWLPRHDTTSSQIALQTGQACCLLDITQRSTKDFWFCSANDG